MKRIIFAIIALLTLLAGYAQLQHILPSSVQLFFDERADRERMINAGKAEIADSFKPRFAPPYMLNGVEMVDAFIDIESTSVYPMLRAQGVIINCEFDGFITAQIPVKRLEKVSQLPGVTDVEISQLVEVCTDSTLRVTHAGQVLNGPDYGLPQAYDGTGVIVGVIDLGFDYQHLAFRSADDHSRSRIVRVYDTADGATSGHPVMIGESQAPGSVFMGEQLDTMTCDMTGSHGTHTASIAAGMHVNGYGGMAPNADIVLCAVRDLDLDVPETRVANAVKYIYSYADSVGKPCVISMSVSLKKGSHDGKDRLSQVIAQSTGPGRIFVIAAGNAGGINLYTHGAVTREKPLNMLLGQNVGLTNPDAGYFYKSLWLDVWVRGNGERVLCKFHIFDKWTKRIVWESDLINVYKRIDSSAFSEYYSPDLTVDSQGYLSAVISRNSSGKYELQCYAHNLKSKSYSIDGSGYYSSRYQIGLSYYAPSLYYSTQPDSCYIDAWMCMGDPAYHNDVVYQDIITESGDTVTQTVQGFYTNPTSECCINCYATSDSVISAGAFIGRNSHYSLNENRIITDPASTVGALYYVSAYQFSGCGPTGEHLPTVTAPGYYVVAAGSRYSYFQTVTWHPDLVMRTEDGNLWGVMSGTSMAAPTVAGIIAQWLQINPALSPSQVKDVIAQTAIKDNYTQPTGYGRRFGPNGKIDAMAGAQYILSLMEEDILLGDVNGDGDVTIRDVTTMISYVLGGNVTIVTGNADLSGDGDITIADVTRLIRLVLNKNLTPVEQ